MFLTEFCEILYRDWKIRSRKKYDKKSWSQQATEYWKSKSIIIIDSSLKFFSRVLASHSWLTLKKTQKVIQC